MIDSARLDEIDKYASEATVGPWEVDGMDSGHSRYGMDLWITAGDAGDQVCSMDGLARAGNEKVARDDGGSDAWFIVNARTDVPELVAEVRRLQKIEAALLDAKKWKRTQEAALKMSAQARRHDWQIEEALDLEREARKVGESADELERILEGKCIA